MQPIIISKIICPTCKAYGFQPDCSPNTYIYGKLCATCSGEGFLTRLEQLVGLEIPYPVVRYDSGEVFAQPNAGEKVRITPELAQILLDGHAFIDDDALHHYAVFIVNGRRDAMAFTLETLLYQVSIAEPNKDVPLSRLREAGEEWLRDIGTRQNTSPVFNEVDDEGWANYFVNKYLEKE